ncbi:MAG: ATP-dependent zinc metalloprotease FtsH [Clostridia bacterium]|nr:ATP-dependent zinc metalloprotease FtsH [Clostridia bacterium]
MTEIRRSKLKKTGFLRGILSYVLLIGLVIILISSLNENIDKQIDYTTLMSKIETKEVKSITLSYDRISAEVVYKNDTITRYVTIPSSSAFMESIEENVKAGEFELKVKEQSGWAVFLNLLPTIGLGILTVLMLFVFMQQMGGGNNKALSFGRNRAKLNNPNSPKKITFDNVAGLKEEKEELAEIVDFLKEPKKFRDMGARIPKGILLVGGPGTGKTLLAKAVAGEAKVPFFSISGSDFVEMFVGVGASRVRDLFEEAKKLNPCIVFIDEIDAVGRQRGTGLGGGHDEREQTLNQLLVEMDGFGTNENIIVMAATNRPDILDPALLRPGRFDRQVVVGEPDIKAREEILRLHAKGKPFVEPVDFKVIAKNTSGFSGADLENMVNESALLAARKNKKQIDMIDVEEALVKVMMGPEKRSKVVSDKDKKLTAYIEAGHAIVSRFLKNHDTVHQISIIPRGMAGGYTMYKPNEDKSYASKLEMEEHIVSLLGGRVAEKLVLDDISTGASNDIERASKIARNMVMRYGMSDKLGPITFGVSQEEVFLGRDFGSQRNYSEKVASEIDEEVKRIVTTAYDKAEELLKQNMDKLHKTAELLLEKEKIDADEFDAIFEEKKETKQEEIKNEQEVEVKEVKETKTRKKKKDIEDNKE